VGTSATEARSAADLPPPLPPTTTHSSRVVSKCPGPRLSLSLIGIAVVFMLNASLDV
ncbi:unnamed protein product, partial [Nesidiocoris tenuis]